MAIKSILVAYSGDAAGSSGLGMAMFFAQKYGAHLTGFVWHGPNKIESRYTAYMTKDMIQMLTERQADEIKVLEAAFQTRVAAEFDTAKSSFINMSDTSGFKLSDVARSYDLVVMGNRVAAQGREFMASRPDVVALRSGRPVLLVPHEYPARTLGESAVLAWDGQRAASRAMADAYALLDPGATVTVLSVGHEPTKAPGDDIVTTLGRHGFNTQKLVEPAGSKGVAQTILDTCKQKNAGMLVMGAYEHSKFSEDILGGVTQNIQENAHLPILMSH